VWAFINRLMRVAVSVDIPRPAAIVLALGVDMDGGSYVRGSIVPGALLHNTTGPINILTVESDRLNTDGATPVARLKSRRRRPRVCCGFGPRE